jgi:hypothetical protein
MFFNAYMDRNKKQRFSTNKKKKKKLIKVHSNSRKKIKVHSIKCLIVTLVEKKNAKVLSVLLKGCVGIGTPSDPSLVCLLLKKVQLTLYC